MAWSLLRHCAFHSTSTLAVSVRSQRSARVHTHVHVHVRACSLPLSPSLGAARMIPAHLRQYTSDDTNHTPSPAAATKEEKTKTNNKWQTQVNSCTTNILSSGGKAPSASASASALASASASSDSQGSSSSQSKVESRLLFKGRRLAAEAEAEDAQKVLDQHALDAVDTAVKVNLAIALTKAATFTVGGSSAMFGEAMHSVADVANQYLLRVGIRQSMRTPNRSYNYGFMRDRFVFSLISGVIIFTGGACASTAHGIAALVSGDHSVSHHLPGIAVLAMSLALESYSLAVAYRAIAHGAAAQNLSVSEYITKGRDPTSIVILAEDSAAVVGCAIAGVALAASSAMSSHIPDAIGSLGVGSLLMGVSYAIVQVNRQLLLGRSMDEARQKRVLALLMEDPVISYVYESKSEEIGPGKFRFMAEVEFNGRAVVERYLARIDRGCNNLSATKSMMTTPPTDDTVVERFRRLARADAKPEAFADELSQWGEGLVEAIGDEVDRVERKIRELEPGILHVELEPH